MSEKKVGSKNNRIKAKNGLNEFRLSHFLMLALAGAINAFGVTVFLFPVGLYDSGISGLSMLLDQITPSGFTLSFFLLALNIPVFIFGLKKLGGVFTVYSIFTVSVYALSSFIVIKLTNKNTGVFAPLFNLDLFLCAIFGGLISGVGSGITIRYGGAIDGIDVLSVVFAKKIGVSIGTFVMIFNAILYAVCGIAINSWTLPLYSIVTYYVGSKTVDFIVEGFDKSKCAMIVTTKANEISDALSEVFNASGTIVNAIGGYSKDNKEIIYFIVNRFQINKLRKVVHELDESAFISLQDVSDVIKSHEN